MTNPRANAVEALKSVECIMSRHGVPCPSSHPFQHAPAEGLRVEYGCSWSSPGCSNGFPAIEWGMEIKQQYKITFLRLKCADMNVIEIYLDADHGIWIPSVRLSREDLRWIAERANLSDQMPFDDRDRALAVIDELTRIYWELAAHTRAQTDPAPAG